MICHYGRGSHTPPDQLQMLGQLSDPMIGGDACMADWPPVLPWQWPVEETGYETHEQSVEWMPWHSLAWLPLHNIGKPSKNI
jgi:hypothetical protein